MCGRFVSSTPPDQIAKYFGAEEVPEKSLDPSYNVAPTNDVYVVMEDGGVRKVDAVHWGLVPIWAKDMKIGNRMINARAETVAEKNAYRHAFRKKRCIIPADAFFEWTKVEGQKRKQPWLIERTDGEPFAFAGLWEIWRGEDKEGDEVRSCTIVTTTANKRMAEIHDRMPVILPPNAWERWLDEEEQDAEALGKLLVPAPPELITMHRVSTEVNNPRNQGAHLLDEVDADASGQDDP